MWIKCSERLPEQPMLTIVYHSTGAVEICPWAVGDNGNQQFFDEEEPCIGESDITHWMPLIPPPATESASTPVAPEVAPNL